MSQFLPKEVSAWLRTKGEDGDVVLSSRVRLARNFAGFQFVNRSSSADRQAVLAMARHAILESEVSDHIVWVDLNTVPPSQRAVMRERRLISAQLASGDEPRAVAVSMPDEDLAIMVNEEDHLRMQAIRPGAGLAEAFEAIDAGGHDG